ncbi:hypothetical protein [Acanthopleuribacter pedis]|uniref:Uncharacterized protein n=1 Tax=Acanthopleuribacter pedis TaxID=442870 RepID=A0A8J7U4I9_9BACT|nr:hypothetical protein [Acanthopleuribacter pedis]MBO1321528.1 hypothetical protein [Acanthopleuribacter pedis]
MSWGIFGGGTRPRHSLGEVQIKRKLGFLTEIPNVVTYVKLVYKIFSKSFPVVIGCEHPQVLCPFMTYVVQPLPSEFLVIDACKVCGVSFSDQGFVSRKISLYRLVV